MRVKALFMLSVFMLVILFPGYGRSAKNEETIIEAASDDLSALGLLKRCIYNGISVVEEERGHEEEGDAGVCFVFFNPFSVPAVQQQMLLYFENHEPGLLQPPLGNNYAPPDSI